MKNNFEWFKSRLLGLLVHITPDPFKVADIWRRLGIKIGEGTCIYRNVNFSSPKEPITIGKNCVLTGCTILAHDASTNRALGLAYGGASPMMPVIIEDNCFIGFGSIILMGVTIGEGSVVGAGAVVTKNVPPNVVVAGNPAKVLMTTTELVAKRKEQISGHPEILTIGWKSS